MDADMGNDSRIGFRILWLLCFQIIAGAFISDGAYGSERQKKSMMPALDPALRKGAVYEKVRPTLLKNGWEPVTAIDKNAEGELESRIGEADALYRAGFKEVQRCGATGYCLLNFVRNGVCLRIVTLGDYRKARFPTIYGWRAECYKPE